MAIDRWARRACEMRHGRAEQCSRRQAPAVEYYPAPVRRPLNTPPPPVAGKDHSTRNFIAGVLVFCFILGLIYSKAPGATSADTQSAASTTAATQLAAQLAAQAYAQQQAALAQQLAAQQAQLEQAAALRAQAEAAAQEQYYREPNSYQPLVDSAALAMDVAIIRGVGGFRRVRGGNRVYVNSSMPRFAVPQGNVGFVDNRPRGRRR